MLELEQQLLFRVVQRDGGVGQLAQMDQDGQALEKREQGIRGKIGRGDGPQQLGMKGIAADTGGIVQVAVPAGNPEYRRPADPVCPGRTVAAMQRRTG
ncbi:hypothetical protein [Desulfovibrio piger]|uniref:hypothetical protein n=1 Tax=Desulfovibrio piger TaxID=901 RepID=UPI0026EE83D5|nr:hypothetical protein [Desulfovibrio piger]